MCNWAYSSHLCYPTQSHHTDVIYVRILQTSSAQDEPLWYTHRLYGIICMYLCIYINDYMCTYYIGLVGWLKFYFAFDDLQLYLNKVATWTQVIVVVVVVQPVHLCWWWWFRSISQKSEGTRKKREGDNLSTSFSYWRQKRCTNLQCWTVILE